MMNTGDLEYVTNVMKDMEVFNRKYGLFSDETKIPIFGGDGSELGVMVFVGTRPYFEANDNG